MFTKEERSSFKYWFAHWCSYQMTALNLKCWKFKYLFHDIEKPWLKLFLPYKKVQAYHRNHSKHHVQYWINHNLNDKKVDWEAMVIDWECSRFTKASAQLNARYTLELELSVLRERYDENIISNADLDRFRENIENIIKKLKL